VKRVLLVGLLLAGAASAQSGEAMDSQLPGASGNASQQRVGAYALSGQPVHLVLEPGLCDGADAPVAWRDVSDPWRFASQPLEQLSADGSQYEQLRSLLELRLTAASLRVFVLGASAPTWGHLQVVPPIGWQLAGC